MKRVIISVLFFSVLFSCRSDSFQPFIAVDLVGYNVDDPKQAFLVNTESETFEIVNAAGNEVVYSGEISDSLAEDSSSGDQISVINFSKFNNTGKYFIRTRGVSEIKSLPFTIGQNLYKEVTLKTIESYYYARCGTAVNNGEPWKHSVCHLDDAVFFSNPNQYMNVTGGWHDAGDYNKFSINTTLSAGLLLYLYEMRPRLFTDNQLNIPESDNKVPDLLDEVRWALEWLMKMQNDDGGVFHKVSQKKWVGEFLPQKDSEERYIFEITSNSTAGFTAVAALGANLFEPFDSAFANRLNQAALKGWQYLQENPKIQPAGGFKNPKGVIGGEYGDDNDKDVRLWAAVELYKLTQDERYLQSFTKIFTGFDIKKLPPLSWKNFESLALGAFMKADLPPEYNEIKQQIFDLFTVQAERLLKLNESNNYRYLLNKNEFYWGSNSVNLAYAFVLIQLYEQNGNQKYYKAALDQLHYTLGRNPFNISYVTGIGNSSVRNPYHQFSEKLDYEKPVPGMLVGGPNNHLDLRGHKISDYPAKSYEDRFKNYLVNEVAINYTAIFAYVAGYFASTEKVFITN